MVAKRITRGAPLGTTLTAREPGGVVKFPVVEEDVPEAEEEEEVPSP